MTRTVRRTAALVASILIGLVPVADGAGADTPAPPTPTPSNSSSYSTHPTAFSLTISPTRLVVAPATIAASHRFLVVNRGQTTLAITVQRRNFVGKADGSLIFQAAARYSASTWVTVTPSVFSLSPGRSQWITARIAVPTHPEPGDHQVALVFLVPAGRTGANVRINRGVATPVYIAVPGATTDTTVPSNLGAPGFSSGGRVTVTAKVHDSGNVHRDFRGTSSLGLHASGEAAAFPDFTVLRGSTRNVTTTWQPPLLCVCHVRVTIANADGTSRTVSVRVIVFPVVQVLVVLGALLLLLVLIVLSRRRYRVNVHRAAVALQGADTGSDA